MATTEQALALVKAARTKAEELKRRRAELEGRRAQLMDQLAREFNCTSLDEADKMLAALDADAKQKQSDLNAAYADLQEQMEAMGG